MQKGYEEGLMSKMVTKWHYRYTDVLTEVDSYQATLSKQITKASNYDFNSRNNLETSYY
jgi:hypothetical protein